MILSRRARRFEREEDVRQFRMARSLDRDLLHPAIAEKVWLAFVRGDFAEAVFTAMRTVEIVVREAGGLAQKQVGTKLMEAAFGQGGSLRDPEADIRSASVETNDDVLTTSSTGKTAPSSGEGHI